MFRLEGSLYGGALDCAHASGMARRNGVCIAWTGVPELRAGRTEQATGDALLQAYGQKGADFTQTLPGPFALALADEGRDTWLIARDPAGAVPLYYAQAADGGLVFATTIAALLPKLNRVAINSEALLDFLAFFLTVDDKTFFDGVRLLPQGAALSDRGMQQGRPFIHESQQRPAAEWVAAIEECLATSIAGLDAPNLGFHLSGGIDSSFVAALASRLSGGPHPSYAAFFPGYADYDESPYGERVARQYGLPFHRVEITADQFDDNLSDIVRAVEEPKCHPPVFSRFMLEKASADDGCRRIVTGRGADELFTGYDSHRSDCLERHRARRSIFKPEQRSELLNPDFLAPSRYSPETRYDDVFGACPSRNLLEQVLALDYQGLMKNWLVIDHKISSFFGAESVAPFLTRPMIDLARAIPLDLKHDGDDLKTLLKEAARPHLPRELLTRKKVGFRTPMTEMFHEGLEDFARERLECDDSTFWNYFSTTGVAALLDRHFREGGNLGWQLWALLTTREWFRIFLERKDWQP